MAYDFSDVFKADNGEEKNEIEIAIEKTVSAAKKCLTVEDFIEYRKAYKNAEERVLDLMMKVTTATMGQSFGDMSFYGTKMAVLVNKLIMLRSLLDAVESDVRKERSFEGGRDASQG